MNLKGRRGDISSPIILWLVLIIAILIIVLWYAQNVSLASININAMDEDLKNIHYDYSLACNHDTLESSIPLHSRTGYITINDSVICVAQNVSESQIRRCLPTPCTPTPTDNLLVIDDITKVFIKKDATSIEVWGG